MAGIISLALAYIMSQFYRSFLAVLAPVLSTELGMSNNAMSQALGAWFIAFALFQFAVGPMLDRLGPRITAASLLLIGGAGGAALFALASASWMVILAMAMIGIGCSPVLMATFFIFRQRFSAARFAVLSSTFIAVGMAGNLLGTSPLAWMAEAYGWRMVLWGLAAVTALIAIGIMLLVSASPRKRAGAASSGSYLDILRIRDLWPILPVAFFTYAVIANIRGLWAGPFFAQVHGLDATAIGQITFWVAIAMVAGSLAYGPLDTVFNSRKKVVLAGNLVSLLALVLWALAPGQAMANVTVLLIVMGFTGTSYGVIMAHGLSFVPADQTGRGATLLNFCSIGGTGLMQSVSGFVYDAAASPVDPLAGYVPVLWLYAATLAGALVIYAFARDVKPNDN